jgi:hypothetical protein
VSFDANEAMPLQEGAWSWISFPRMVRYDNDAVSIPLMLNNNITPNTYPNNYLDDSKLQYYTHVGVMNESLYTTASGWNSGGVLDDIQSTLGYKLFLDYNSQPEEKWLFMQGSLYDHFDPDCGNCRLDLDGTADEYWVGYYYLITQNILDAMPDHFEPKISIIKGQYFSCHNSGINQDGSTSWLCAISKRGLMVKYGEMIEIRIKEGESISDFYWTINNNTPDDQEKMAADYYTFTETADYTPIFVELDTTDNPLEIGAFVNDSCIGATTVFSDDSVVLVAAYNDSLNGEIYFEQYYGSGKSGSLPVTEYYVEDNETRVREKRIIHTSEQQVYYVVSFKNNDNSYQLQANTEAWIRCNPNPVYTRGNIEFYCPESNIVKVMIYDIYGNVQNTLHQGYINAGKHIIPFTTNDIKGRALPNGAYILSLKSTEFQAQTKIIVIN